MPGGWGQQADRPCAGQAEVDAQLVDGRDLSREGARAEGRGVTGNHGAMPRGGPVQARGTRTVGDATTAGGMLEGDGEGTVGRPGGAEARIPEA